MKAGENNDRSQQLWKRNYPILGPFFKIAFPFFFLWILEILPHPHDNQPFKRALPATLSSLHRASTSPMAAAIGLKRPHNDPYALADPAVGPPDGAAGNGGKR